MRRCAGQAAVAFGTYPRPSRVSGCVEFASLAITAAPSRYLSLEGGGAFEAATLAIQFSASACDLVIHHPKSSPSSNGLIERRLAGREQVREQYS